jgi:hypothetical protein
MVVALAAAALAAGLRRVPAGMSGLALLVTVVLIVGGGPGPSSLAYDTARPILRWDWIEAPEIDRAADALRAAGHVVDPVPVNGEEPLFRARFAGTRTVAALGSPVPTTTTPYIRAVVCRLGA